MSYRDDTEKLTAALRRERVDQARIDTQDIATAASAVLGTKAVNPKDSVGSTKLPLHLWPASATAMGCMGLLDGAMKYGRANWRATDVRASIYVDAAGRHLSKWFEGEDVDPDSGLPHFAHALACLAILVDAQATNTLVDDRNFNGVSLFRIIEQLTPMVSVIQKKYEGVSPHHFTITDKPQ